MCNDLIFSAKKPSFFVKTIYITFEFSLNYAHKAIHQSGVGLTISNFLRLHSFGQVECLI